MLPENEIVKIDETLLLNLFRISSPSSKEDKVQDFIKSFLNENKIIFKTDKLGNIYQLSIEDAPLLSSHMDTVEDTLRDSHLMKYIRIYDDKVYGKYLKGYGVIGGDDKCGVFIILSLLRKYKNKYNFIFSVNEEHGMTGINFVTKNEKFDRISYGLVLDRRGAGDIICVNNSYGTKTFQDELEKIGTNFGYKPATGAASDAGAISEKVSCANLSVGYYNPHSKKEFVILSDLQNAMTYTQNIIIYLNSKFIAPEKSYGSSGYYYKSCKICYHNETSDRAVLKWSVLFKAYICSDCFDKIVEMSKDDEFIRFSKTAKNRVIDIPINRYEGD